MGAKRIHFKKYDSSGKFQDGRIKLDVYFTTSDGEEYVWTPQWKKGMRDLFLEAYRVETLNEPGGLEKTDLDEWPRKSYMNLNRHQKSTMI